MPCCGTGIVEVEELEVNGECDQYSGPIVKHSKEDAVDDLLANVYIQCRKWVIHQVYLLD